jgi:hypothetical protein
MAESIYRISALVVVSIRLRSTGKTRNRRIVLDADF